MTLSFHVKKHVNKHVKHIRSWDFPVFLHVFFFVHDSHKPRDNLLPGSAPGLETGKFPVRERGRCARSLSQGKISIGFIMMMYPHLSYKNTRKL